MKNPKAIAVCIDGDPVFQYESSVVPSIGARIHFAGASYLVVSHDHDIELGHSFEDGIIEEVVVTVEVLP